MAGTAWVAYVAFLGRAAPTTVSRRLVLGAAACTTGLPVPSAAAPTSVALERAIDETLRDAAAGDPARVEDLGPYLMPRYALEAADVFYPEYFLGDWDVESTTVAVVAPLGESVFGGGDAFRKACAQARAREKLGYSARWLRSGDGRCVCDRLFNVASITRAALGPDAVVGAFAGARTGAGGPDGRVLDMLAGSGDPAVELVIRVRPAAAGGAVFR